MALGATRWMRPSLLKGAWDDVRLSVRLLREPRVPVWAKAVLPLALVYLMSPLDILPDYILGIGEIDDLLVLYGAMRLFVFMSPRAPTTFHREAIAAHRSYTPMPPGEDVIDAEFRRES